MTTAPHPFDQILTQSGGRLQAGDLAGAEAALAPLFAPAKLRPPQPRTCWAWCA